MSHTETARLTGPMAVPNGSHYPAGWVSPEAHDAAERERIALELAQEQEEAANAAREQAVTERIAERRGHVAEAEAVESDE